MVVLLGTDRRLILMTAQRWKSELYLCDTLQMNDRIYLGHFLAQIPALTLPFPRFLWFFSVVRSKYQVCTLIKPQPPPSISFPIHHSLIVLSLNTTETLINKIESRSCMIPVGAVYSSILRLCFHYQELWALGQILSIVVDGLAVVVCL